MDFAALNVAVLNSSSGGYTPIELPIPPLAVGLIAFGVLMLLLIALLVFGKGREHS